MNGKTSEVPGSSPNQQESKSLRKAPPPQETPGKIDTQILEQLGLSQDDVEKYNEQKLKEEREISVMQQKGVEYYNQLRELVGSNMQYIPAVEFGNFNISIDSKVLKGIPDSVARGAEKAIDYHPQQKKLIEEKMKAFC